MDAGLWIHGVHRGDDGTGRSAAAVDGVSIRTAKYAMDNFIPIVGGMFADTVDTLVGCSLIVQNAVGVMD